ncbi:hypothetical protein RBSH_00466 [Rhodopirellula baltica SH28]|uniref:Uncharacterized protein n=2 Tax=Rhodopirellula baltica TaxID=265606 RepID=F2AXQ7_RHOBT|nr:hypothetical protein RBWH47_00485 [Rhodopirellula baltica WH47]EKK04271.1 hypothetical protein RBSH_00466 [Rhodopirellula baltica SH28]
MAGCYDPSKSRRKAASDWVIKAASINEGVLCFRS